MEFTNIFDFEKGQVFVTKKGNKMEVIDIHTDKVLGKENGLGSVEMKVYVKGSTKWFRSCFRTDGKFGLLNKLRNEGWKVK